MTTDFRRSFHIGLVLVALLPLSAGEPTRDLLKGGPLEAFRPVKGWRGVGQVSAVEGKCEVTVQGLPPVVDVEWDYTTENVDRWAQKSPAQIVAMVDTWLRTVAGVVPRAAAISATSRPSTKRMRSTDR